MGTKVTLPLKVIEIGPAPPHGAPRALGSPPQCPQRTSSALGMCCIPSGFGSGGTWERRGECSDIGGFRGTASALRVGARHNPRNRGAGPPRIINADTHQPGLSPHSMRNTGGLTSFQLQGAAIRPHKPGVCGIWRLGVRQTTRACISAVSGIQTRVRKPMVWPHDYIIRIATPRGALGISSLRRSKTLHTAAAIGPSNPKARTWWLRVRSRMRLKLGWEGGPWRRDASADHECCGGAG